MSAEAISRLVGLLRGERRYIENLVEDGAKWKGKIEELRLDCGSDEENFKYYYQGSRMGVLRRSLVVEWLGAKALGKAFWGSGGEYYSAPAVGEQSPEYELAENVIEPNDYTRTSLIKSGVKYFAQKGDEVGKLDIRRAEEWRRVPQWGLVGKRLNVKYANYHILCIQNAHGEKLEPREPAYSIGVYRERTRLLGVSKRVCVFHPDIGEVRTSTSGAIRLLRRLDLGVRFRVVKQKYAKDTKNSESDLLGNGKWADWSGIELEDDGRYRYDADLDLSECFMFSFWSR